MSIFPDVSLFIQIVNFLFLLWVMNLLLYKPIRGILAKRKGKIGDLEQSIETLSTDAGLRDKDYLEGVKAARLRGLKEKETLVQSAGEQEKEIIQKINLKAQADLAEVRDQIVKDAESVRQRLQEDVEDFAAAISQKILGRVM